MDSTKIPITKNVLDTSIHYICTNNLKLSSCLRLSNNINSKYHFDNIKILLSYPRARSTPVIPYRYFSNMIFSGRRILAEDCAPQFLTFSINIHLVP